MILILGIILLGLRLATAKHGNHAQKFHNQIEIRGIDEGAISARQDSFGAMTTGLQPYSTTYTYSFWSYSPMTAVDTTAFSSSRVTTSTVITIFATDQFHAFQSLLTAGQAVQDSASSSAAQATETLTSPISVTATITSESSAVSSSTIATAATSNTAAMIASTTSRQVGSACSAVPGLRRGIALAGILAMASL